MVQIQRAIGIALIALVPLDARLQVGQQHDGNLHS